MTELPPVPDEIIRSSPALSTWSLILAYRGSIAHGMKTPSSDPNSIDDVDLIGICIPSKDYYLGLKTFGTHDRGTLDIRQGQWDIVVYEAQKMFRLLAQGNPNVMSLLWLPGKFIIQKMAAAQSLIDNREIFLSKRMYKTFAGYADAQMGKMRQSVTSRAYMGEKRRALVDQFGYDAKNASHMIRLLRMGIETLKTGDMQVERIDDRDELLSIKRGEWSLDQIETEANRLFAELKLARDKSDLPEDADIDKISDLCKYVIESAWMERDN